MQNGICCVGLGKCCYLQLPGFTGIRSDDWGEGVFDQDRVAGKVAKEDARSRITPGHIELGVRNDLDLARYFQGQTFFNGGTTPTYTLSSWTMS
jgi:hypothetical protein